MRNKFSWILVAGLTFSIMLLIVGWFGIPYFVGQQVKNAVSKAGFAPGAVVSPAYFFQKIRVTNITIIPTSSPVVKKIHIPELILNYDATSLFYRKASTIEIPTVEILVAQPFTQFMTSPGHKLNPSNIDYVIKMLPRQKLIIHSLIIKAQNASTIKLNNIFKMQLSLKPALLRKGRYTVKLSLDGANPKIIIKDTSINGTMIHAKMDGVLLLKKDITFDGKVKVNAKTLVLPEENLRFEKINAAGKIDLKNNDFVLKGNYILHHFHILKIAFIQDPLTLHGNFKITKTKLHVDLQGNDIDNYIHGRGSIDHDILSIEASSHDFVTQNLNLESIFAWLTQPIIFSKGVININGRIGLSSSAPTSLHIIGTNLAGNASSSSQFNGLNTNLEIVKFNPFTTAPKQQLSITEFNPGLPFKNVNLVYQILPDKMNKIQFQITSAHTHFAGGTLSSSGFLFDPNAPNHTALLSAHNIHIDDILKFTKVQGLSGSGTLSGAILFQWGVDGLKIKSGHLKGASTDSKISYIPDKTITAMKAQSPQLTLALNALKNFHYKNFVVNITSHGNETYIVAKLTGYNPDLYNGLPINLNFTLTGELNLILDTILIGNQLKRQILSVSSTPS